ncbi:isochorismate synthase [Rhodococcus sp. G-MC3]|uniref:isochorismate synthase n=1 Tax=Rhodococcus sp. G-MC3 TaxID=3046209 RepID=UPI0024B8D831|nr:isochorismate synthase [Rhodococcus sp. G-MC3]MDJ0392572.1 isochorismate synthase [Rhodococcus sp. G-MC3]
MTSHIAAATPTIDAVAAGTPGSFVLSRPHGSVTATGVRAQFDDAAAAADALRSGDVDAVVGALPFSRQTPSALTAPLNLTVSPLPWQPPLVLTDLPEFVVGDLCEDDHIDRVRTAVNVLRTASTPLQKVVLARRLALRTDAVVDPRSVLAALVAGNPSGNGYLVDLGAAGGSFVGRSLVGSSPEVLIRRQGRIVTCHPLAGSAPRHRNETTDREIGRSLAESPKDRREHAFVVDAIRTALSPFCSALDIPRGPTVTHTPQLWHLGTPIRGELHEKSTTALDLALALHPTPAVCGTPTDLAYSTIDELEGDRGFYAGAIGWCDANGDGEWMVAIRCAEISRHGREVTAYAGGGIVAESDPDAELRETITKFGTVLSALGVSL